MTQNLQGLSYEICSADITESFRIWIINSRFCDTAIIHQQLVAMRRGLMKFFYNGSTITSQ